MKRSEMKVGDKVRIIGNSTGYTSDKYPFLPDDSIWKEGKIEGHIVKRIISGSEDEPTLYMLKLDKPLKVGVIPEGESAFAYEPTEWWERTDWSVLDIDLELVK